MSIRCLIIDDKPLAVDILVDYTRKVPFLELVESTTNPIQGLSIAHDQSIDLVFLDIQMPELTGLQFMKIAGKQCKVILTTAYSKYALDGFEHDVIDYLLKPIAFDRFYRAAEKARQIICKPAEKINTQPNLETNPEHLFVKTERRIQKVNLTDILYVEGLQNYISIHTLNGRVLSLQTLKKIEGSLPMADFVRVHKSFIISLRHISAIERSRIFIGDIVIPVGDNYREGFYGIVNRG
jgi:two-component system LytT family response regulator